MTIFFETLLMYNFFSLLYAFLHYFWLQKRSLLEDILLVTIKDVSWYAVLSIHFESFNTFSFLIPELTLCDTFPVNYHLAMFNSKFNDVFNSLQADILCGACFQVSSTPLIPILPKPRHLILKKHWSTFY